MLNVLNCRKEWRHFGSPSRQAGKQPDILVAGRATCQHPYRLPRKKDRQAGRKTDLFLAAHRSRQADILETSLGRQTSRHSGSQSGQVRLVRRQADILAGL
jgi:hypothetical protein